MEHLRRAGFRRRQLEQRLADVSEVAGGKTTASRPILCIRRDHKTLSPGSLAGTHRICEDPTAEDHEWFPDIAGGNWLEVLPAAMRDFKDESFIQQFLSPKVMRDFRLFCILDDDKEDEIEVRAIHDYSGYRQVRELLASQYNMGDREPNIQVVRVDVKGDRSLTLQHARRPLGESADLVLKHFHRLWGFPVRIESTWNDEIIETRHCPEVSQSAA